MSIELLQADPRREHLLIDDLEALFWVLVFFALHYCKHGNQNILNEGKVFDQSQTRVDDDNEIYTDGGLEKASLLTTYRLTDFPFASQPLKNLITELSGNWANYQARRILASRKPEDAEILEILRTELGCPALLAEKLRVALKKPGWLPDDVVADQFPRVTRHEAKSRLAMSAQIAKKGMLKHAGTQPKSLRRQLSRVSLRGAKSNKRAATSLPKGSSTKKAKLSQLVAPKGSTRIVRSQAVKKIAAHR